VDGDCQGRVDSVGRVRSAIACPPALSWAPCGRVQTASALHQKLEAVSQQACDRAALYCSRRRASQALIDRTEAGRHRRAAAIDAVSERGHVSRAEGTGGRVRRPVQDRSDVAVGAHSSPGNDRSTGAVRRTLRRHGRNDRAPSAILSLVPPGAMWKWMPCRRGGKLKCQSCVSSSTSS
jgi:hypothetical protein